MPLAIHCAGCQQRHLIRDQLAGYSVRCDCGCTQAVPFGTPSVPAPTGLLDAPAVQVGSIGLLLVSALALGGVIAWVVSFDAGPDSSQQALAPTSQKQTTKKKKQPATTAKKVKRPSTTEKPKDSERDNPQLLAVLEQLKAPDLETNDEALKKLAEMDTSLARQAIPAVVAAAQRQNDRSFRRRAADRLRDLGPPSRKEDYSCLKDALQIPHPALQHYAVTALKEMGEKAREAMFVVVEALKHRNPEVQREAFGILKSLGPAARPAAFRLLLNPAGDADEEASLFVLKLLLNEGKSLSAEEMDALIEALRDGKRRSGVRYFVVAHLGEGEQTARAVPALLDVLREKSDAKLLSLSLKALGRIGDKRKEVVASLMTLAKSAAQEEVRLESLQILEQLEPSALSAGQILERWTAEDSSTVRQELDKMLQSRLSTLKREQMKELLPLLRHKDAEIVVVGLKVVQIHKEDAADVAETVADLLKNDSALVRAEAVNALESLGLAADKPLPKLSQLLLDRLNGEKEPAVRQALSRLLRSRLAALEPERMKELLPLLGHKDAEIVVLGLKIVQAHKEKAAGVAEDVAGLLKHDTAKVRVEALHALETLGSAGRKAGPGVSRLLDSWLEEKDPGVRQALANLLKSRLSALKRDEMKELLPLLRHKDSAIVLVGLKVVQDRKEDAADVAEETADLLKHKSNEVREEALSALKALGTAAGKALPKLFAILDATPQYHRASLAVTVAGMVDDTDSEKVQRVVAFLLECLHPQALEGEGKSSEAAVQRALNKIGEHAVDGCIDLLRANIRSNEAGTKENAHYRMTLYATLAKLGPKHGSKRNYEFLSKLWVAESKKRSNENVTTAARRALDAMKLR